MHRQQSRTHTMQKCISLLSDECSYIANTHAARRCSHARVAQRHHMLRHSLHVSYIYVYIDGGQESRTVFHVATSLLSCPIVEWSLSCIGGSSPFRRSSAGSLDELCKEMGGRCMPLELDGRYGFVPLSLIEGSRLAVIRGEAILEACSLIYFHGNCRPTSKLPVIEAKWPCTKPFTTRSR